MSELELAPVVSDLSGQTLEQLADIIRAEDAAATGAAASALMHAIRAGEGLLEARRRVEPGGWQQWATDATGVHHRTVALYMRLATYRDRLGDQTVMGIVEAQELLRGLPDANFRGRPGNEVRREEARRLRADGLTLSAIAEELGASASSVWLWVNPEGSKAATARRTARQARVRAAERALREKEERAARDAAAKAAGADIDKIYSLLRTTLTTIDQTADRSASKDEARALRALIPRLQHDVEEIYQLALTRNLDLDQPT